MIKWGFMVVFFVDHFQVSSQRAPKRKKKKQAGKISLRGGPKIAGGLSDFQCSPRGHTGVG